MNNALDVEYGSLNSYTISQNSITEVCNIFLENYSEPNLTKRCLEGFLSAFVYNKHGYTDRKQITDVIYE